MSNPTMSTKFVTMRMNSFPRVAPARRPRTVVLMTPKLFLGFAESGGRDGAAHETREGDDCQNVRDDLDELRGNAAHTLQLDLECLRGREEEARGARAPRIPSAEDDRRDRDEAAPG